MKPEKFEEYAHYRAIAMHLPGHEGDSPTHRPDYEEIEELLVKSWGYLFAAVKANE